MQPSLASHLQSPLMLLINSGKFTSDSANLASNRLNFTTYTISVRPFKLDLLCSYNTGTGPMPPPALSQRGRAESGWLQLPTASSESIVCSRWLHASLSCSSSIRWSSSWLHRGLSTRSLTQRNGFGIGVVNFKISDILRTALGVHDLT